jgi:hypothetical protein
MSSKSIQQMNEVKKSIQDLEEKFSNLMRNNSAKTNILGKKGETEIWK